MGRTSLVNFFAVMAKSQKKFWEYELPEVFTTMYFLSVIGVILIAGFAFIFHRE